MNGYLLDTSTCVAMFRGDSSVGAKLNEAGRERCFITQIVLAELLFGAYRSKQVEKNLKQTYDFIQNVKMLPYDECVETFAKERARLWDAGTPIEDFDLLIGCAAKAAGLTVVTHNVKHFSHIEGLEIEDWVKEM